MEQVRNVQLDNLVESIANIRSQMAALRADEAADLQGCHRIMREKKITTYRHSGVELARVPGEEKLRVRTSGEATSAETREEVEEPAEERADLGDDPDGGLEGADFGDDQGIHGAAD